MSSRVYLDHAATTPLSPVARAAMLDAYEAWANPSSPHAEGRAARAGLEATRVRIAEALGWRGAILFTSGASEAIAMVMARAKAGRRIVSAVEHDAVRRHGEGAVELPVGADGRVTDVGLALAIERAGEAPLVAVQAVNSETGVIQPLDAIGEATRGAGGLWLCDATQAVGKMALPDADFLAFSAHKFGGPSGIGALLVKDLAMLAPSGGQEQGYRGGTEDWPSIAGMAAALGEGSGWIERADDLRAYLDAAIEEAGGEVIARHAPRLATIASYRMPGMAAAAQLIRLDSAGFAVSAGSACSSGSLKPSHVLAAMGLDAKAAGEVIRVSFGRTTRREDVWRFAEQWRAIAGDAKARAA
ncbi:aminotransferase class V-fold PLP-dependent enzyme [Sphingomonas sp. CGMCC 1.13654]|uniref:Cysteine desulfurase n=1 Tax=Sphingomonas chungangi TaxID=2683589 RepID=A0A838LBV0_9SPHN|nr:aminotransferase class V-fold PLP-dependent enzyme [Sphingomonas chungangi]MBA2936340.1 aminotransferase class V-fold PLP-dependent enzyme [Sphingomonas chungangi]MVW55725.1 aminotransferase class V-fold PLP-dependent enzyme [Sphingomonas chungangi]